MMLLSNMWSITTFVLLAMQARWYLVGGSLFVALVCIVLNLLAGVRARLNRTAVVPGYI